MAIMSFNHEVFESHIFNPFKMGASFTKPLSVDSMLRECTITWGWAVHTARLNFQEKFT